MEGPLPASISHHLCRAALVLTAVINIGTGTCSTSTLSTDWCKNKQKNPMKSKTSIRIPFLKPCISNLPQFAVHSWALCQPCAGLHPVTHLGMSKSATTCKIILLSTFPLIRVGSCTQQTNKKKIPPCPQAFSGNYLSFHLCYATAEFARALLTKADVLKVQSTNRIECLGTVQRYQFSSWRAAQTCLEVLCACFVTGVHLVTPCCLMVKERDMLFAASTEVCEICGHFGKPCCSVPWKLTAHHITHPVFRWSSLQSDTICAAVSLC